jgi:phage shock protein A
VKRYKTRQIDNRDATEMYDYMEARIEALKRRILQLEAENETLRWNQCVEEHSESGLSYAASA